MILLVLNLPLAPIWARLLLIPRPYLYAGILFFASLGAHAVNGSLFDLYLLLIIGVLGFVMWRFGLPIVPAIIGVILGPEAERQGRLALQASQGDLSGLVNTLFSIAVYIIVAIVLLWPLLRRVLPARIGGTRGKPAEHESVFAEAVHVLEETHHHEEEEEQAALAVGARPQRGPDRDNQEPADPRPPPPK